MSRQHHYLKIEPEYYIDIESGIKTFEIRYNDRNYKVYDILYLQEYCNGKMDNPQFCKEGFVILGIRDL